MQAIILAGGFATRLRPLSCSKPKLLFPIIGTPLVDRILSWLQQSKINNVILAVNHMSDLLAREVNSRRTGVRVRFSVEPYPLGTGGPIRLARQWLRKKEPFLIVNGDIVTNVDLNKLISLHVNGNAEATIALVRVDDPRPYGIATVESNGRISKFVEKSPVLKGPAWINAGIYVLDPNIITQIKAGKFVSLEREIFPGIAANKKMLGLKHHGYWYDIGNTFDYIRANMELLKKHEYSQPSKMHKTVKQPSYIGKNCRIDSNARLGPRVILSDSVHIGDNTQLSECIIFEKTRVGAHCHIQGCVIGENVVIGNGTKINHGSIVAGQIKIPENSVVKPGSSILNW